MRKRKHESTKDLFVFGPLPRVHIFRAGDAAKILGVEKWRLEKFLTGKQYKLSPSGHIGKGRGSWRLFSHQDLYRIGIADQIVADGFTARFVSMVLQEVEDRELLNIDERGESRADDIAVFRTEKGPSVTRKPGTHGKPYYVLNVRELIQQIDRQIEQYRKAG